MFNGLRAIVGFILFTLYFLILALSVKLITGSVTLDLIFQFIPVFIILVDTFDRVVRFSVELKKQFKRIRFLNTQNSSLEVKEGSIVNEERGSSPANTSFMDNLVKSPKRYSDGLTTFKLKPYCIMASVYNIEEEWKEILENLAPWRDKLFFIDDASTDNSKSVIANSGVKIVSNPINTNKPGAIYYGLSQLPPEIETVVVIDPDIELSDKVVLERSIFDFQRSKAAACGLEILPTVDENRNLLEACQTLEYEDSMSFGRIVPHNQIFISGAAAIFDRKALDESLKLSTRSVYAEDFETSLILISDKLRTYFDDRVLVRTEVPTQLKKLTLQRMGWRFGLARVTFKFIRKASRSRNKFFLYHFYIYTVIINILLHPFRILAIFIYSIALFEFIYGFWNSTFHMNQLLPLYSMILIALFYVLLSLETFIWSKDLKIKKDCLSIFVYPFYKLYLHIVPNTLGYTNYLLWILFKRKLFNDKYEKCKAIF